MKTIQSVPIWDNGKLQEAKILNTYAVNVVLNKYANFAYFLFIQNEDGTQGSQVAQGNLTMNGTAYEQWQSDSYAWDWVAQQLNLVITGDFVQPEPPKPEPIPEPQPQPKVDENPVVE